MTSAGLTFFLKMMTSDSTKAISTAGRANPAATGPNRYAAAPVATAMASVMAVLVTTSSMVIGRAACGGAAGAWPHGAPYCCPGWP